MLQKSRTSICSTAEKSNKKKKSEHFEVQQGDVLHGGRSRYTILQLVGSGSYGKVAWSVDLNTKKEVAVKVFEAEKTRAARRELKMLGALSALDPAKANVVQFFESFTHRGLACLAFEMLDKSVHQLMCDRRWKPLSLAEIRLIAEQLLTALNALKSIGVIHGDLKSDNVMLVNHESEPFKVKLIDFGLSSGRNLKVQQVKPALFIMASRG
uniref:Protein kinase domain-containing protein n=1 Tax=Labrus bergylta TaxID=56723 RepID=A0A3Q3M4T0_9LABR